MHNCALALRLNDYAASVDSVSITDTDQRRDVPRLETPRRYLSRRPNS